MSDERCVIRQLCRMRYIKCCICRNHNPKSEWSYFQWKRFGKAGGQNEID